MTHLNLAASGGSPIRLQLLLLALSFICSAPLFAQTAKLQVRVQDTSGGVMPNVPVRIYQEGRVVFDGITSATGAVDAGLSAGEYVVELTAPGFEKYAGMVTVRPDALPLVVVLRPAQLMQTLNVTGAANQVSVDTDASLNTTILNEDSANILPSEADDLEAYLQLIAGVRGGAGEDLTFIIDGFSSGRIPPKEQIQEIRINTTPFSAEFSGVALGRTEIVSRAGTGEYHGNATFLYRDAALSARNPFATSKPPYQQRNFNASFSGPVIRNKATLNLNARDNENQNSDTVQAILPSGPFSQPVVMPAITRSANARGQWAVTRNNTFVFNADYQYGDSTNQGIGGFTLPERAWSRTAQNTEYQIRETAVLSTRLVHEARFSYRRDYNHTRPLTDAVSINVLDAFNAGGAQNESVNDNRAVEGVDMWMYSRSKWSFKSGVQLLYRLNHNTNYNNFGGTFTFSTVADYIAGNPVTFSKNQGNPFLDDSQIEFGTFFQSEWKVRNSVNLSLGARYEAQTNISDYNNLDPRVGFAYQVSMNTVLRGGIGVFHLRLPQNNVDQLIRFDGIHQQQIIIEPPSYPDPFLNSNTAPPISMRSRSPNLETPYNVNASLSFERSLPKGIGVTFSWDGIRSVHLYRSRDINAPVPPAFIRPNPSGGSVYQLESTGTSRSDNFTIGFRQTLRNWRNLNMFSTYTLGWNYNDTDGSFSLPASSYDLRSEWGRAPGDQRHRFVSGFTVTTLWAILMSTSIQANSNRPFNITTGYDGNHDGATKARPPGVGRNTGIGPRLSNVNVNLQKTIPLRSEKPGVAGGGRFTPTTTFMVNFWNAFNTPQYPSYSGVMTSPFFGKPNRANNPRNIEVGLRLNF